MKNSNQANNTNLSVSDRNSNQLIINHSTAKKKLLVHSCCGPCSGWVLTTLATNYDLSLYYFNPNIYPVSEFTKRLMVQIDLLNQLPFKVDLVLDRYLPSQFDQAIKNYEHLPEKSLRCYQCYQLRIQATAQKAQELKIDAITTTLSVSPHKNSHWINEIGNQIASQYQLTWVHSDFKKQNGYQNSLAIAQQYQLYRQDYCGCIYSKKERKKHE